MNYRHWLRQQINALDTFAEFDLAVADDLRRIVADAGQRAARAGIPEAVTACQIRAGGISPSVVQVVLAKCLAACEGPKAKTPPTAGPTAGPYSVQEAAALLRVSPRKLYADCANGLIAHEKAPIRISAEALAEYGKHRQRQPIKTSGFRHLS